MKLGIKGDYVRMMRGKYGIYFDIIHGRKIILEQDNKRIYVGYKKAGNCFEFTDLRTGFLITATNSYSYGIKEIFNDFSKTLERIHKIEKKFEKEVNQLNLLYEILQINNIECINKAVLVNE